MILEHGFRKKHVVLVVDAYPAIADAMGRVIEQEGKYEPISVSSASEALSILEKGTQKSRISCMLLMIRLTHLPEIEQLILDIQKLPQPIRVISITTLSARPKIPETIQRGTAEWLIFPFKADEMFETIRKVILQKNDSP